MAGILQVMAGTLADAADECGEVADLLREIRGALHRSLRAPEEELREQVRLAVRELDVMLAGDHDEAVEEKEGVEAQARRISLAIRVALPEVRDLLSQHPLEPSVASELHTELVRFLEAFLPELRHCLPNPRD
jgi:hypothetical protein